eukprot:Em0004g548a
MYSQQLIWLLMQKASQCLWTESCQAALEVLKKSLIQAPVQCYKSLDKPFILQTDASAVGIGAVPEQEGHVVVYASRSLTLPERSKAAGLRTDQLGTRMSAWQVIMVVDKITSSLYTYIQDTAGWTSGSSAISGQSRQLETLEASKPKLHIMAVLNLLGYYE